MVASLRIASLRISFNLRFHLTLSMTTASYVRTYSYSNKCNNSEHGQPSISIDRFFCWIIGKSTRRCIGFYELRINNLDFNFFQA